MRTPPRVRVRRVPDGSPVTIAIRYLADMPEAVSELAEQFRAEWEPYYGATGPGNAEADLLSCCRKDDIPLALVAVTDHGKIAGTGALKAESVGAEAGEGPWIAALLVVPDKRGKGIGTALVAALEDEARRLRFPALYTSTDTAGGLLLRRGWRKGREVPSLRGPITLFRLDL